MRSRGLRPNDYDPTAFVVNDVGTFGNLGRNTGFGPNAGRITATTTTSRQIQLALKFIF